MIPTIRYDGDITTWSPQVKKKYKRKAYSI